ncbi:hypothetical protein QU487_04555 [Crenobacter sp. SG2305]|uniref:hypothetical protein n=1 Tax=Crenobacter oryzisoli TaxID=3056844 RepID=UPI0025AAAFCF|nr:hypothetical protein [Crenobacter sp. SG2305]MDN0082025.1 hypothetical protein [Crenobacter sp. SG2305]
MKQMVLLSLLTLSLPALAQTYEAPAYANRVNGSANLVTESGTASPMPMQSMPPAKHHNRSSRHHRKPMVLSH